MKKETLQKLISSIALVIATAGVSAQAVEEQAQNANIAKSDWMIAPHLGASSFTLKGSDMTGNKSGMTVGANVYKSTPIESLDMETGLLYMQAGAKQDYGSGLFTLGSIEYDLDYLAIPLGVKWTAAHFGNQGNNLYLKGGAMFAYLTSAKAKASFLGSSAEEDLKDHTNKTDWLGYAGVGYTYNLSFNMPLLVELNYLKGTQNVLDGMDANKNEGFVLAVQLGFSI